MEENKKVEESRIKISDDRNSTININGIIAGYTIRKIKKDGLMGPPSIKQLDKEWLGMEAIVILVKK
jgi:hypothetical protein